MTQNKQKLARQAKNVIKTIPYITLATSNKKCRPWNSPVYSVCDNNYTFYWSSWIKNQHSKNILENENVFVVIYDSTSSEGTGFGVYMEGKAYLLGEMCREEIVRAITLLHGTNNKKMRTSEEFLGTSPRRIFKFVPKKIWVNSEHHTPKCFVDVRIDITPLILS